jgi:hypothetical protein
LKTDDFPPTQLINVLTPVKIMNEKEAEKRQKSEVNKQKHVLLSNEQLLLTSAIRKKSPFISRFFLSSPKCRSSSPPLTFNSNIVNFSTSFLLSPNSLSHFQSSNLPLETFHLSSSNTDDSSSNTTSFPSSTNFQLSTLSVLSESLFHVYNQDYISGGVLIDVFIIYYFNLFLFLF